jgi:hypothetical protein
MVLVNLELPQGTAPVSIFDNYKWRGPHPASLAFFEYCMLVRTKNLRDAVGDDVDFDPNYPRYCTHVQHIALSHNLKSLPSSPMDN